jgi:hypothetical protein
MNAPVFADADTVTEESKQRLIQPGGFNTTRGGVGSVRKAMPS